MTARQAIMLGLSMLCGALAVDPESHADPSSPSTAATPDCGTISLYYLLGIMGHPTPIEEIRAVLPGRNERGYSLKELTEGARRLGLEISGVRLRDASVSPDRPMIAFLKRNGHGHYVVIRPVGHTGKLVQVLDGFEEPDVIDIAEFSKTQGWTGLGLIPDQNRGLLHYGPILAGAVLIFWALRFRGRRRQSKPLG